ncbi:hypothetical protein MmarC5_0239 [Methanococcus maripaludis C5]|uniref:Uncharacterized protein n=1 Tax=Methanococcus maripaludis (strain C5 / ATCC BAA-1333) TaxID=402880 RepID=A4FWI0_METM5|nr:hypothetical protein [Methanococcus maripaludis]ABO34555.1 hypothetical protein MmarC5_0239 [Methanococcus maripaludis C5]
MSRPVIYVYCRGDEQKEEFTKMAKRNGFENTSEYARTSMIMYDKLKDILETLMGFDNKLNSIVDKFDSIESNIDESNNKLVKSLSDMNSELKVLSTNEKRQDMLSQIFNIMSRIYPQRCTFEELGEYLGVRENEFKRNIFWELVNSNPIFDEYVERDGNTLRARLNPKTGKFGIGEIVEDL